MTKTKKFTLKDLDLKIDHINKKERYYLNEEKSEYITYNVRFSKLKKDKLIQELFETIAYFEKQGKDYFGDYFRIIHYLNFLIFKYFTSIFDELKDKSKEVHFETYKKLYDSGLLDKFINEVFDETEIGEVYELFKQTMNNADAIIKFSEFYQKQLIDNVKSDVLKERLNLDKKADN